MTLASPPTLALETTSANGNFLYICILSINHSLKIAWACCSKLSFIQICQYKSFLLYFIVDEKVIS